MITIRANRVVTVDGERPASVNMHNGTIVSLTPPTEPAAASVVDVPDDEVVLPGLVDSHVHVNEPGRTHWEGFAHATAAAAAGGVTTIVDMPLNSIPATVDVPSLRRKQLATQGQLAVDVAFWGGAVPGNAGRLASCTGPVWSGSSASCWTPGCPSSGRWIPPAWSWPCAPSPGSTGCSSRTPRTRR